MIKTSINGILLLDKPLQISSNGALQQVKRLFAAKKAGHTGSLDPLATGMLPICFGEATKFSQFLLESDKYYEVSGQLGVKTTTGDAEGEVIEKRPIINVTPQRIQKLLANFTGVIQQIPPMYSAIKHQGKPLYALARKGMTIERQPRQVTIHEVKLKAFSNDSFGLFVHCSKGTYIRTLIEDLGEALGCGAYVTALRRTAVAPYQQFTMYTFDELGAIFAEQGRLGLQRCLLPVESSVHALPSITLSAAAIFYMRTGQSVMASQLPRSGHVRMMTDANQFLGIGEVLENGLLAPRRLLAV